MIIFLLVLTIIGVSIALFFIVRKILWSKFMHTFDMRLLLIQLPQELVKKESKNVIDEINLTAQLFTTIANAKVPFVFETAVHVLSDEIFFYVATPANFVDYITRQIQGLWANAKIEHVEDYTIFHPKGGADAVYLKQKEHYALPLRTYVEANIDTFLPILSNFAKIQTVSEGLTLQLIVRPIPVSVKKSILNFLTNLKKGKVLEKAKDKTGEMRIVEEEKVKAVQTKLAKPLFLVNARIVASAANPTRAEEVVNSVIGSLGGLSSPVGNELKAIRPRNQRRLISQYIFRQYDNTQTMVLGIDELASIFHFPTSQTDIPKIRWLKAKEAPPPPVLSSTGVLIGESIFRGETKPVRISDEDRRRHVYLIGQTGTGKSNLLVNMAADDIRAGKGVGVIDPHGDLIETLLQLIPEDRHKDVIIFDPSDIQRPVGLNMLEYDASRPEQKTFIVNEMQSIFNRLFAAETMGPMFEQYMRNALLLLMDDPSEQATLIEVPRVFTDVEFRRRLLAKCTNPTVVDFWEKEAIKAGGEAALVNITPYITSKFNNFIANDYMRPIIGQPKSAFNFRRLMDEGKIFLVNLSKGRIGDINAGLLGMIIVGKLLMAALSRVDLPQEQRRDFNLYIDEFQNFTTDSIAVILSEARKYRLNLVIAHQFIAQLVDKIKDAVFGNVGSIIVFRVGPEDAEFLVKHFEPVFSNNDLVNLDNFHAYVKLLVKGETVRPFNIRTIAAPIGRPEIAAKLKAQSRAIYGQDRKEIEAEVLKRLRT